MSLEYVIYADESSSAGRYYSDFYGGVLVRSTHLEYAKQRIAQAKADNNLFKEVKWNKVTEPYLPKYISLIDTFFDLVAEGVVKVRIMFRQTAQVPTGLHPHQINERYHRLYYQFLKHSFGLKYSDEGPVRVRVNLDMMPCTIEEKQRFADFIASISHLPEFRRARVEFARDQVSEVRSHDHDLMQCLDVVLGAMQFRLNDWHKEIPEGARKRGKRTVAKERLYKHISARIRALYPNFNIGESTGTGNDYSNRWKHPYRHWKFVPKSHKIDESRFKP
jgi:hypothetical protein